MVDHKRIDEMRTRCQHAGAYYLILPDWAFARREMQMGIPIGTEMPSYGAGFARTCDHLRADRQFREGLEGLEFRIDPVR